MSATIAAIKPSGCTILVVADNCTDATAVVARAAGAQVAERTDLTLRGKGHALAFARAVLADDPPDVIIVMDADCTPIGDTLAHLARHAMQTGRAVQARNELDTRPDDPPMTQISNFAFSLQECRPPARADADRGHVRTDRHRHGLPVGAISRRAARHVRQC